MVPKKTYGLKSKTRAPRRPMAKKPLVKLIKAVATKVSNAGLETKYVVQSTNNIAFNSGITQGFNEVYSLIPPVSAGNTTSTRLGLDLTPIKVKNTFICSLSTAQRTMNIIVDLWCLQMKQCRNFDELATAIPAAGGLKFLRNGNAALGNGTQLYTGINTESFLMINKEQYTLLKHFRFQLVNNVGSPNGDTTSTGAPNVALQSMKTLSYVVDHPKQYRYDPDTTGSNYPNGHAPFWCAGYSHTDGSAVDVANTDLNISWISQMIYKDA